VRRAGNQAARRAGFAVVGLSRQADFDSAFATLLDFAFPGNV